MPDIQQNIAPV